MKRSAINDILGHTRQFFSQHDVHLPPFASFSPAQWQQLDTAAWEEVFDAEFTIQVQQKKKYSSTRI